MQKLEELERFIKKLIKLKDNHISESLSDDACSRTNGYISALGIVLTKIKEIKSKCRL